MFLVSPLREAQCVFSVYTVTGSQYAPDLSNGGGAGAGPWRKDPRAQGSQPTVDGQLPNTSTTMEVELNLPGMLTSTPNWHLVTRLAMCPRSQTKAWPQLQYQCKRSRPPRYGPETDLSTNITAQVSASALRPRDGPKH